MAIFAIQGLLPTELENYAIGPIQHQMRSPPLTRPGIDSGIVFWLCLMELWGTDSWAAQLSIPAISNPRPGLEWIKFVKGKNCSGLMDSC
jgi:hypothetical protein